MGLFTRDIKTINDLFVHTLRDIYYAEQQIVKSLPEMIEKVHDAQLKQALQSHLGESKNHVKRLEEVFRLHGSDAKGVDCPAIDGILEEAEDELRVCGARVLEGRRGPDVLATNDHRMFLPELGPDLVDGGLVRGVEFLRFVHLDRVLPRTLVPEVHGSHALGSTDAGSENKVSPHPTNLNRSTRFGFEVYPDSPRPFRV